MQSAKRAASNDSATAPIFERSEPGFGQTVDEDANDASVASLDTLEPTMGRDVVDADHSGGDWESATQDLRYQNDHEEQQPTGVATPIQSSYESEEPETEVDDVPVLENIVYEGDVASAVDSATYSAQETADEIDSDGYAAEEPEILSDMVEPSQSEFAESRHDLEPELVHQPDNSLSEELPEETMPAETEPHSEQLEVSEDMRSGRQALESAVEEPATDSEEPADSSDRTASQIYQQSSFLEDNYEENETAVSQQLDEEIEVEDDPEVEYAESRPSLKAFLGSISPINKIKTNIQNQLDSVKAERERIHSGAEKPKEAQPEVVVETDFAVHSDIDPTIDTDSMSRDVDELSAPGYEFVIEEEVAATTDSSIAPPEFDESMATLAAPVGESHQVEQVDQAHQEVAEDRAPTFQTVANDSGIAPAEGFDKLSQIDYYVKLSGERDVSRDSVLAIYREGASGIERTHSIYGLRLPEKVWRDVEQESEEARFGDLVVTIQLVDQVGSVTETDMTRFSSLIMKLSESTGRGFSFMAPIESAHMQAQAIERFKQRFDSIFVVNIRPLETEMFEGAVIERCAKQIGLTADENQFFTRYKPVGKQKVSLYSLANMSDTGEFDLQNMRAVNTRGVTFFTRPAINRSPGAVFAEMVDAAKAFASRIKGEVIAPGYEDLSTDDAEAIRRSIEKVAAEMESHGINPGSEEANRLFG